ncbi:PC4-domain-containing protein [Aureobasidium subglaciale]|nr:PC4-domain-containing protein [Aureobasidium subglaciale]
MPPKSKKRASKADDYDSDGGFVEDAPQSKRTKKGQPISEDKQVDEDGNPYWELSGKRRVTLSEFKKVHLINIREYYEKDGQMLPGKKGISMTIEQFSALLEVLPEVEEALKEKGQELPRPNYSLEAASQEPASEPDEVEIEPGNFKAEAESIPSSSKLDKFKYGKKNHEATSDEED